MYSSQSEASGGEREGERGGRDTDLAVGSDRGEETAGSICGLSLNDSFNNGYYEITVVERSVNNGFYEITVVEGPTWVHYCPVCSFYYPRTHLFGDKHVCQHRL
jgi:hypothetical protein